MIHVDTHVLVWLYEGAPERFTARALAMLEAEPIAASPMAAAAAAHPLFAFTRDPFDRLIAAQAHVAGVQLLTKDRTLRSNLDFAVWP